MRHQTLFAGATRAFARTAVVLMTLLVLPLGSAALTSSPAGAATQTTQTTSSTSSSSVRSMGSTYAKEVLRLTNRARAARHLPALKLGGCVTRFATRWSAHMASRRVLVHQGLRPILRECHGRTAAENIAVSGGNTFTPAAVVRAWMNSRGHRANILDRRQRYLGVSAYRATNGRIYVTQDFAG